MKPHELSCWKQARVVHRLTTTLRRLLSVIGITVGAISACSAQSLPQNIPDFCAAPTITSTANGAWSNSATWTPARVPVAGDVVNVAAGKTVTYDVVSDAALACVGVRGTLTTRTDIGTRLTVANMLVYAGGTYTAGTVAQPVAATVTAELVIADAAINTTIDPLQYGTGVLGVGGKIVMVGATKTPFLQTTADALAGATSVSLTAAPAGWRAGDKLALPATDQWYLDVGNYVANWEVTTYTGQTGSTVSFSPLVHAHRGARNQQGAVSAQFHVGNLTRNVIVRSANPTGTRGHFLATDRTDLTLAYVALEDLGRTTAAPIDASNPLGRYALHAHHLDGPVTPQPNGRQFTFIGLAIVRSTKWGVDIHDSHYGLLQNSVIYDADGASVMIEDGDEKGNIVDHNFMLVALGPGYGGFGSIEDWATGGSEREDAVRNPASGDRGWSGSCIWEHGVMTTFTNNVCANANGFGIYVYNTGLGVISVPAFQGADHLTRTSVDSATLPMAPFDGNTIYATADGASFWNICTEGTGVVHECPVSLMKNTTLWGMGRYGYYGYSHNRLTIDGWAQYGDLSPWSWSAYANNRGIWFGDYSSPNTTLKNIHIEGLRIGVMAPFKPGDTEDIYGDAGTPFILQDSFFANEFNIAVSPMYAVGRGDGLLAQRHTFINNVQFGPMNTTNFPEGWGTCNLCRGFELNLPNVNIIQKDEVTVTNYNNTGRNFQVYYAEQAPSFVVPVSGNGVTGAPVAGLTNTQLWAQYGKAVAGSIAPCATTEALIQGFVCGSTAGVTPPAAPGTAIVTTHP